MIRDPIQELIDEIAEVGFAVIDDYFPEDLCQSALLHLLDLEENLAPARVGQGAALLYDPTLRGDLIKWIDEKKPLPVEARLYQAFSDLGSELGRRMRVAFAEFEGHFALYKDNARYVKHVDAFKADDARFLSTVLYLNRDWTPELGGQLQLYKESEPSVVARLVEPVFGRLVVFLSRSIFHEVLPSHQPRRSIAGWFKVRAP